MIGRSSRLFAVAVGAFVTLVALSLVCAMLRALLPVLATVALVVVVAVGALRWRLFRWRGW